MEHLINIRTTWKHATLEYLIKQQDGAQDMSRAAVFQRAVKAAENVTDWKAVQLRLADLRPVEGAPVFTNLQARYSDETAAILQQVREDILRQLADTGLKVLQMQYMMLLLQENYLCFLKRERMRLGAEGAEPGETMELPEMAAVLCRMMLTDKNCTELKQIADLMVQWRNKA